MSCACYPGRDASAVLPVEGFGILETYRPGIPRRAAIYGPQYDPESRPPLYAGGMADPGPFAGSHIHGPGFPDIHRSVP